jgi:hypothetical protein
MVAKPNPTAQPTLMANPADTTIAVYVLLMGRARSSLASAEGSHRRTTADDDRVLDSTGLSLEEWQEMPWWPRGATTRVGAGYAGHDREIVVNFDDFWNEKLIPDPVFDVLAATLPGTWKVESRGTRIEVHPSGRFNGGYTDTDIELTEHTLTALGFTVEPPKSPRGTGALNDTNSLSA